MVQSWATHFITLPAFVAAASDGEANSSIMFKLRKRDGLHEPHLCHTAEDWSQLPTCAATVPGLKGNIAKFVARTHRERSAQRDTIKVPRHRSAAQFHICRARRVVCPRQQVVPWTAPVAGRARAASGHRVRAGCRRARQLRVFSPGESPSPRALQTITGERAHQHT